VNQWFVIDNDVLVDRGHYWRCEVVTISGRPLHKEEVFLKHLAELTMQRYEIGVGSNPVVLPDPGSPNPRRTKHHYRRLFLEANGRTEPTQEFITHASESMGVWLEWSRSNNVYAEGGFPHNSDPAYDVLSIVTDDANSPKLQVVQVKATKDWVHNHANDAIAKFEELEKGYFDAELSSRLELLESKRALPGVNVAELLFDLDRRYRVTLVHGLTNDQFELLTTYDSKIKGSAERRSAFLIRTDFDELWNALGKIVYGQLV
jgi:hypothetical protein